MDDKGHIKMKIKDILNKLDMIAEAPAQPTPSGAPAATNAATVKALQDRAAGIAPPTTSTAGAGRGGQGGPTATQAAQATPAPQAAQPKSAGGGRGFVNPPAGTPAAPQAAQPTKPAAKSDPAVKARQEELIKAGAKIKADGIPGPKTDTAEKEYGQMANAAKGDTAVDNAAAIAASNASNAQANAQQRGNEANPAAPAAPTPGAPSTNAASLRANLNAAGSQTGTTAGPDQSTPQEPTASGQTPDEIARLQQLGGIPPQTDPTQAANPMAGVNTRPAGGYGQFANNSDAGQAAQPAPAAPAAPAPVSTVQPTVKSGSGGTVKSGDGSAVKSRSDLEIAWANMPGNRYKQYPGDAAAQQQVGAQQAAGQKNLNAIKNFFGGNKQPATGSAAVNNFESTTFENAELSRIVNLVHHR